MSTEMVLLEARLAVSQAQEDSAIVFGLFAIAAILFLCWLGYLTRSWSWIPRNRHQRVYRERF